MAHDRMFLKCAFCGKYIGIAKKMSYADAWTMSPMTPTLADAFFRVHLDCLLDETALGIGHVQFELVYESEP